MSDDRPELLGRCGTCARFVRVREIIDDSGEVKRAGECLLGVWPSPLYEVNTCTQYVRRGTFTPRAASPESRARTPRRAFTSSRSSNGDNAIRTDAGNAMRAPLVIPEELLDMNADEFREVLREVIRDELGVGDAEMGGRWLGGEMVLKPGKEGTQEKRIPIEAVFRKVVAVRDKLRVLEQKVNSHPKLSEEDKVQMQQYVTQCYGSLTTFNVLFANKGDVFVGQKGDKED
jgi:hypothetical protein